MAKIIEPAQPENDCPAWKTAGETFCIIALDANEAIAIRTAVRRYHEKCERSTAPGSLNGAGGRVYEALAPLTKGMH